MNQQSESITTLLFDWDGTVVDSAELGLIAFQKSFAALGLEFHQPTYETAYSPNWYSLYEAMGLPQDKWAHADELWIQHYGEQTAKPIAGATGTIRELARKGYVLGVVSSGSDCRVRREIDELGFEALFQTVVCNEQMTQKKPYPEGLETAMHRLNVSPSACCYVGDSPEDIEMGRRAGVMTAGVRSSYPTSWKLSIAKPDIFLTSFSELTKHF